MSDEAAKLLAEAINALAKAIEKAGTQTHYHFAPQPQWTPPPVLPTAPWGPPQTPWVSTCGGTK